MSEICFYRYITFEFEFEVFDNDVIEPLQDEDIVRDNGTTNNNNNGTESGSETDEIVIERIVSHVINGEEDHPYAEIGEPLYRVRWYHYVFKILSI